MNKQSLQENQYWIDISSEEEAKRKIITHENFDNRTEKDVSLILQYLQPQQNEVVIDFGCGIGRLSKHIASHCGTLIGFDISEAILHYALQYCRDKKNVMFKPMLNDNIIEFGNQCIDKIYSIIVLQHISKPKIFNLLCEFNRVLKVGGKVFLQFPNLSKCEEGYKSYLEQKYQLGDLGVRMEYFTKEELQFLFKFAHLDIIEIIEDDSDYYILAEKTKPYDVVRMPIASSLNF